MHNEEGKNPPILTPNHILPPCKQLIHPKSLSTFANPPILPFHKPTHTLSSVRRPYIHLLHVQLLIKIYPSFIRKGRERGGEKEGKRSLGRTPWTPLVAFICLSPSLLRQLRSPKSFVIGHRVDHQPRFCLRTIPIHGSTRIIRYDALSSGSPPPKHHALAAFNGFPYRSNQSALPAFASPDSLQHQPRPGQ